MSNLRNYRTTGYGFLAGMAFACGVLVIVFEVVAVADIRWWMIAIGCVFLAWSVFDIANAVTHEREMNRKAARVPQGV